MQCQRRSELTFDDIELILKSKVFHSPDNSDFLGNFLKTEIIPSFFSFILGAATNI